MLDQLPDWKMLTREQKVEMVRPLVQDEGLSSTQIAARFRNTTRNTIIGLCHRHRWQLKGGAGRRVNEVENAKVRAAPRAHGKGQPKAAAIVHRLAMRPTLPPTPPPEPFDMEDGDGVDVTALVGIMQNKGCKFIHGDPLGQHGYCGKPFKSGSSSWCPSHFDRVFVGGAK